MIIIESDDLLGLAPVDRDNSNVVLNALQNAMHKIDKEKDPENRQLTLAAYDTLATYCQTHIKEEVLNTELLACLYVKLLACIACTALAVGSSVKSAEAGNHFFAAYEELLPASQHKLKRYADFLSRYLSKDRPDLLKQLREFLSQLHLNKIQIGTTDDLEKSNFAHFYQACCFFDSPPIVSRVALTFLGVMSPSGRELCDRFALAYLSGPTLTNKQDIHIVKLINAEGTNQRYVLLLGSLNLKSSATADNEEILSSASSSHQQLWTDFVKSQPDDVLLFDPMLREVTPLHDLTTAFAKDIEQADLTHVMAVQSYTAIPRWFDCVGPWSQQVSWVADSARDLLNIEYLNTLTRVFVEIGLGWVRHYNGNQYCLMGNQDELQFLKEKLVKQNIREDLLEITQATNGEFVLAYLHATAVRPVDLKKLIDVMGLTESQLRSEDEQSACLTPEFWARALINQ